MAFEFFDFNPILVKILRTRVARGRSGKEFSQTGALSSVNTLATLRNLCLTLKPERTLEIGMCFGGSALVCASTHRDLERTPSCQHVVLDPYQTSVWDDAGLLAIERAGLAGYIDFRPSFSSLELPRLHADKEYFDLIYIDGSHLFEDVFVDFFFASRILNDGKILVFDDNSNPHVRKVIRFIQTNFAQSFAPFSLDSYRADEGKSFRYRVGGLLGKRQLVAFRKIGPSERPWDSRFSNF